MMSRMDWRDVLGRGLELVRKELLQLWRDRVLILFLLYVFTVDIYLAGSGLSFSLHNATIAVMDQDMSHASRELASRFQPPEFQRVAAPGDPRAAQQLLDTGRSMVVMQIPPRFQADLGGGRQAAVQYLVDSSNSVLGLLAGSHAAEIVGRYNLEQGAARLAATGAGGRLPGVDNAQRALFNANQNEAWFMGIAELLMLVTVFAIILPAVAAVREKERGTIEQLLVSPLRPLEILLPKVLAMTLVILAGVTLAIALVLRGVFDVPIRGSLPLFYAISALYVFTTSGIGLLLATIARNLAQVGMLAIMVLAPMMFLSGMWTPPEALATPVRVLMAVSPMHYYIDAGFGVLLKGMTLAELAQPLLAMALLGALAFGAGLARFRRQFA
jgi:ABC-2 type transport system permease protein